MTRGAAGLWRADLALTAVVAVWGITFVTVHAALAHASTLLFLALRFSLATLALGLSLSGRFRRLERVKESLRAGMLAGICLFGGYYFQTAGLRYTTPSKSAFITALSIVTVPILVWLVHRGVPRPAELAGVVLSVAGLGLMTLAPGNLAVNRGDVLTAICALGFAFHIIVLAHYAPRVSVELLSLGQIATTALVALATFWWAETPRVNWTPGLLAALVVTGLFATALAFTVQTWAQRHTTPTRTALILALEPVFALVASLGVGAERLSLRVAGGGALILAGVLVAELKPALRGKHL
jgi:drug/metabolite transporter (DMT)-like permease